MGVTLNNIMENEESKKGEQELWDLKVLEISIEKDLQDLENGLHQGKESSMESKKKSKPLVPCKSLKIRSKPKVPLNKPKTRSKTIDLELSSKPQIPPQLSSPRLGLKELERFMKLVEEGLLCHPHSMQTTNLGLYCNPFKKAKAGDTSPIL